MAKTVEELAEEHANWRCPEQGHEFIVWCMCKDDYLAGYKAAQEHAHAALEEAEARIQELQDQLADADKVMPDTCDHILDATKMVDVNSLNNSNGWISVKNRLPDSTPMVLAMCIDGYELAYYGNYGKGQWTNTLGTEHLNVTHWHPLPAPPKEEK